MYAPPAFAHSLAVTLESGGKYYVTLLPVFASVTLLPLALLLGVLYHVYFWSVKGATPGKELNDFFSKG